MKRLTRNLVDNSVEAFVLALETINRLSMHYKIEAFCFLFCNAWELLLKAKLLDENRNIFERKKRNKPRKSIGFLESVNRIFTSEKDPIRKNLLEISELRNNATHLVIPFVPPGLMGLFQAGIVNYPKKLSEWFNIILSEKIPLGMMAIIYDFDPKKYSLEYARIHRLLPKETIDWVTEFQTSLTTKIESFSTDASQFYIPIDYKVAIVKNPKDSDIVLGSGTTGKETIIVEVPKDPDRTHPYRMTEVIQIVNNELEGNPIFNQFDFQCIKQVYKIADNSEYTYIPRRYSPQYSEKLVEWIISEAKKNPNFFESCRKKAHLNYGRKSSTTN